MHHKIDKKITGYGVTTREVILGTLGGTTVS